MPALRPFWRYYGAKWRLVDRGLYPPPSHRTIIEPFAGAAGYSLHYPERDVVLVEKYPTIAAIWRYLISADAEEIRATPEVWCVDDLPTWVPQPLRDLVGFRLAPACSGPRRRISTAWMKWYGSPGGRRIGWTVSVRDLVADQVGAIRHWRVIEGDHTAAPPVTATWFVDPPYEGRPGSRYVHGSKKIDYTALAAWCRSRDGQVIACESASATWLPFHSLGAQQSRAGRFEEGLWLSGNGISTNVGSADDTRAA